MERKDKTNIDVWYCHLISIRNGLQECKMNLQESEARVVTDDEKGKIIDNYNYLNGAIRAIDNATIELRRLLNTE